MVQGVWQALNGHNWGAEIAPLAAALAEKVGAPSVLHACSCIQAKHINSECPTCMFLWHLLSVHSCCKYKQLLG